VCVCVAKGFIFSKNTSFLSGYMLRQGLSALREDLIWGEGHGVQGVNLQ